MSGKRSALDALSAAEKAAVLDDLLTARPDLREPAWQSPGRSTPSVSDPDDRLATLSADDLRDLVADQLFVTRHESSSPTLPLAEDPMHGAIRFA